MSRSSRAQVSAVIVSEGGGALIELCGISVLERLLRTLERAGIRRALVLTDQPEDLTRRLAPGSAARPRLEIAVRGRTPGQPIRLGELAPPEDSAALIAEASIVYDPRLITALLASSSSPPTALVDGAVLCGALLAEATWFSGNDPLVDALHRGLESGTVVALDVAAQEPHIVAMRRTLRPYWFAADPANRRKAERVLLDAAQKGTLDIPALVHAPIENLLVRWLWRTGITPNQLTLLNTVVAWVATVLFATGRLGWGIVIALLIGVLDGLDGKLARVKVETSELGRLEHKLDFLYEISWWAALAFHFHRTGLVPAAYLLFGLLFAADLADKFARRVVKQGLGRDLDTIGPVDQLLRLVGGRRNVYVWILAGGVLLGRAGPSYVVLCLWGAATAALHLLRAAWLLLVRRRNP